jgi:hypothetical protein
MTTQENIAAKTIKELRQTNIRWMQDYKKLAEQHHSAIELLKSLVIDVEAMQCPMPAELESITDDDKEHWFGGFSAGYSDAYESDTYIQWPCLGILIEKAKELIK